MTEPLSEPLTVKILPDDPKAMIGRTLLLFGITVLSGVALSYVMRKASNPDFLNTTRLRVINLITNYSDNRIDFWQGVSAKAKTARLEMLP
jgi:hypothetical protein